MAAGEIIGIVLGAGSLIGLAYAGSRLLAAVGANQRPQMVIYGDWPNVPAEAEWKMGAAREDSSAGGSGLHRQRPGTRNKQTQRTNPFRTGDGERF